MENTITVEVEATESVVNDSNQREMYQITMKEYAVVKSRFERHYWNHISQMKNVGVEVEDFVQDCLIKFCKYYRKNKSSLVTFAYVVANSVSNSCSQLAEGKNHIMPCQYISMDDPNNNVEVVIESKTFSVVEDVEGRLSGMTLGKNIQIPAVELFRRRMDGYTLDQISEWIFDAYGKKVSRECVRQYSEKVAVRVKEFLLEESR